jgi:hypothetical protein
MRRAIAEQIEAIGELSKIVARYAGESITPPPAPPTLPPAEAPKPIATRSAVAAETLKPAAKPASRESTPLPTAAEPFGRPAPATSGNGMVKPAPLPPGTPAPESTSRPGNGQARGWVADLLRRASSSEDTGLPSARSEPPEATAPGKRSPAQVVESLNSLSIDIARAIDHEASVELWDRYKRGERNVFTRRLYTLQGQKTFDELRRKYEHDSDFRKAVDNYIGDFERLLSQVSREDAEPTVARMYLTSDTGKVYTMLAHAAGRLS